MANQNEIVGLGPSLFTPLASHLDVAGTALPTAVIQPDVGVLRGELMTRGAMRLVDLRIRTMPDLIKSVFARSAVEQVAQLIVRRITIQMTNLQAWRARLHEGVHDEGVDKTRRDSTLKRESNSTVSGLGDPALEALPTEKTFAGLTRKTSYLALVGNFVQAFMPDYRQPVLGGAI